MKCGLILFVWIVFINYLNVESLTGPTHDKVVVCYIATWAVYRKGNGNFSIEHLDPSLCTHLIYSFAGLDTEKNTIKSLDVWQDLKDDYGRGGYDRLTNLKSLYPHLKVTLAMGGWNEGSVNYSRLAANPERRRVFVKQTTDFIRKYNFDGLDLDWEYPTRRDGAPEDREHFVLFVRELREELNKYNLLLTSAIGASVEVIDQAYDIKALAPLLDFFHIMCYDYGGSWTKRVTFNAPLNDSTDLNIVTTINHLIKLGAPPHKIVLGLPFYGRTFNASGDGRINDPAEEVGFQGPLTKEPGFMGYNEICALKSSKDSDIVYYNIWDAPTSQAILKFEDPETKKTHVATYDSSRSIANKMRYLVRNNLGGAMVWSVDTDDFLGECIPDTDTFDDFKKSSVALQIPKRFFNNYPLLRTINEAIVLSLDEVVEDKRNTGNEIDNEIPLDEDKKGNACSIMLDKIYFLLALVLLSLRN